MIMIMSTSLPVKLLCAEAAQETRNHGNPYSKNRAPWRTLSHQ